MKNLSLFIIIGMVLVISCSDFPTNFHRVDSDAVRLLDFIYEPAEASPGDTIMVKAVFSGKKINLADISWSFSSNVVLDKYGSDTAFNIVPLAAVPQEDYFSEKTSCFSFKFVVPQDLFKTSGQIPENWIEILPPEIIKSLPPSLTGFNKGQLIDMVNLLTQSPQMYSTIAANLQLPVNEISRILPHFSQLFTVQMRFIADIKNQLHIKSNYSVRYHSRFSKIPQISVYVNHNPRIDSIGIYKVKGEKNSYNPAEKKHLFIRIDSNIAPANTVPVEDGYSYFLVAFYNQPDTFQSLFDLSDSSGSKAHLEKITTIWFFKQNDDETRDISPNEFMKTQNGIGSVTKSYNINSPISYYDLQSLVKIIPPTDKSIRSINVWCQVQDNTDNEILHPVGSSLMEGSFTFQY